MGLTKSYLDNSEDHGYYEGSKLRVCSKHFHDKDLQKFVHGRGYSGTCDFCPFAEENSEVAVVDFDLLMERIMKGVNYFFTDPADILGWDGEEKEYLGEHHDSRELMHDILAMEEYMEYDVVEQVVNQMSDQHWTRQDYYGPSHDEYLLDTWNYFAHMVKHRVRYIFYEIEEDVREWGRMSKPSSILQAIGEYVMEMGLIRTSPPRQNLFDQELPSIYRARQHDVSEEVKICSQIGSAPQECAKPGRFSPEGISLFYGAGELETAIEEIIDREKPDELISVGSFNPNRPLHLVDLRDVKPIGMFNIEKLKYVEPSLFIKAFVESISQPVIGDSKPAISYVPSQIVTEYFRFVLPHKAKQPIDGIIYKSIKNAGGDCYAIFADAEKCKEEGTKDENTILIFDNNSIKANKVSDL